MNKTKIGIYPFDEVFIPNLKYESLFDDINFCMLLNYNGDLLNGNEIVEKSDFAKENLSISWSKYDGLEKKIDMLLITEGIEKLEIEHAISVIDRYCKGGVGILLTGVRNDIKSRIQQICLKYGVKFETTKDWILKKHRIDYTNMQYSLTYQKIETPIVAISGVSSFAQGYDIQLNLLSNFMNEGYRVSVIGMGHLNELTGGYSMSDVLSGNNLTEVHKVYFLNHFLKEIEKHEQPDVIMVGIDDPIMPLSQKHQFNFSLYATEIFNAFIPDVTLATLINGEYNDSLYKEMKLLYKYKYNCDLDAYFVSRYVPTSSSMYRDSLSYTYSEKIEQTPGEYVVFSNDDIESNRIYDFVKKKLEQYGRCEQF